MQTKTALILAAVVFLGVAAYTASVYSQLPERMPTHWNIRGEVDGWMTRPWGAGFGVGFAALFTVLLVALPWLSPRNFTVDNFREAFNYIMFGTVLFMGYLQVVILQAGLHPDPDVAKPLIAGVALFMAFLGNLLGKVRRNFWIGIRTPWTLASDEVWFATHRLAARLMVASGLLGAVLVFCGVSFTVVFVLVMVSAIWPAIYSAILSKRLERRDQG
jgi:uncharacterized membrane protein